jgi:AcrR family transcriptional regulator
MLSHNSNTNSHPRFSAEDRRRQILETATNIFALQGYGGTTTREIAERAGVNEAIIFRHFPTKEELYWAVIEHKCQQGPGRGAIRTRLEAQGSYMELFSSLAEDFLRDREQDPKLTRLLLFSALENHRLSHRFFRTYIAEGYEELARYIRKQIEAGHFRAVDPLLAARSFWGMLVYHFWMQELFGGKRYQKLDVRHVAKTLTDIWLRGMLPEGRATWPEVECAKPVETAARNAQRRPAVSNLSAQNRAAKLEAAPFSAAERQNGGNGSAAKQVQGKES